MEDCPNLTVYTVLPMVIIIWLIITVIVSQKRLL